MMLDWIITNKGFLKLAYGLLICFVSLVIFLKSDRLFKISDYQGLRYFRNAFFFYGLAFLTRFILGEVKNPLPEYGNTYFVLTGFLFELFVIFAGFFLFYSLIWKYVEKEKKHHSVFNLNVGILGILSTLFSIGDILTGGYFFMHSSQIILFSAMAILSYKNYLERGQKHKFSKYYFLTIVLGLIAWILNASLSYINWNTVVQVYVYSINAIFFLLFFYIAIKITKK